MKKKSKKIDKNHQAYLALGPGLIAVGVVFITAVNEAIGLAFISIGIVYTIFGVISHRKKK